MLNKVLPSYLLDDKAAVLAERLHDDSEAIAAKVIPATGTDEAQVARVLREVGESYRNFGVVAKREAEQKAELASVPDVVATVPYFETDIFDLAGLMRMAEQIWS